MLTSHSPHFRTDSTHFLEMFDDSVILVDPGTCTVLFVNKQVTGMFLYPLEESVGRDACLFYPLFKDTFVIKNNELTFTCPHTRYEARKSDNSTFVATMSLASMILENQEVIVMVIKDISTAKPLPEREKLVAAHTPEQPRVIPEKLLSLLNHDENEGVFSKIFFNNPVPMFVANLDDGRFYEINDAFAQFLGYTRDEIIGKNIADLSLWVDSTTVGLLESIIREKGNITHFEATVFRKDGLIVNALLYIDTVIIDGETYLIGPALDITAHKHLERDLRSNEAELSEQNKNLAHLNNELREKNFRIESINEDLRAAKKKAEDSDKLKTMFMHNMSHEIRTPMNAIIGFSDLLEDTLEDKEKIRDFARIIKQRSSDLLSIINDILDLSKIESGQVPVHNEVFVVNELLAQVKKTFEETYSRITKRGIAFSCIPLEDQALAVTSDPQKIKHILNNLLVNAFKFTTGGTISFWCTVEDTKIAFHVKDTGIGIDASKLDMIFNSFVQINDSAIQKNSGTGLGLSIARGLVELLGGKMTVESERGKGSTFSFIVPYTSAHDAPLNIQKEFIISPKLLEGKRALVVDDDDDNAILLCELLREIGVYSDKALSGKTAVEKIMQGIEFDVILMDLHMPGDLDGFGAIREIKKIRNDIKIFAQTAESENDTLSRALEFGCCNVIAKPIKRHELFAQLAIHLLT